MNSPWLPFAYQYVISGIIFGMGLLLAVRRGTLILSYPHERWTLVQLVLGFLGLMAFQALMILAAGA
jgi:hypothetical protein